MSNSNNRPMALVRRQKITITDWIRDAMTDDEKGKIAALALVHKNGTLEREIDSVRFGGKTWKPEELAARFDGKASAFAQNLMGQQDFCLFAFYTAGGAEAPSTVPGAAHPFFVQGETGIEAGFGTFPPSEKGEKMQGMAFSQAMVGLAFRQTQVLFDAQARFIETISHKLNDVLEDNHDLFDLAKEMILKAADKEHEHRMAELQFVQSADTKRKLLGMAPALANQFLGKEVFPQSTADTSIVEALMDRLIEAPDGALPMMLSQLGVPAQDQAVIMLRAKQYAEKKAQALEDAKTLTARKPEAEQDDDDNGGKT